MGRKGVILNERNGCGKNLREEELVQFGSVLRYWAFLTIEVREMYGSIIESVRMETHKLGHLKMPKCH